jgi:predicted dehydrogenase
VLVETPLTRTLLEADALVEAEQRGAVVVYGENLLHAPVVARAIALVDPSCPLRYLEARALSPLPARDGTLDPIWGGGVLFELGVHPLALALRLAGDARPIDVVAEISTTGMGVDDHAELRIRFDTGLEARIEASWRHPEPVWDLQASSAEAVVRADLLPRVGLEHNGEPVALSPGPSDVEPHLVELGYVEQVRSLGSARPATGSSGAAFGRAVLELVCAGYASAAAGGPVALPFTGPRDRSPFALWRS